jgi:hypothetical protein
MKVDWSVVELVVEDVQLVEEVVVVVDVLVVVLEVEVVVDITVDVEKAGVTVVEMVVEILVMSVVSTGRLGPPNAVD